MTSRRLSLTLVLAVGTLFPGVSMAQDTTRSNAPDITVPRVPRSAKSLPSKTTVAPKKPMADAPPAQTPGAAGSPLRDRIVVLLSGFEYFPTKEKLEEGSDAVAVSALLQQLVKDASERDLVRTRSVDALGYYNDPQARELLLGLALKPVDVNNDRLGDSMRHHAITSLAKSQKDASVKDLGPLLEDPDVQIRLSAIVALGKNAQQAARPLLLRRLDLESNPTVTRELQRYVRQVPAAPETTTPVAPLELKEPADSPTDDPAAPGDGDPPAAPVE